jgi:hypothetical protein
MRTIQTENATYKIADSRNLEDFVKQLKKPKSAAKRYKVDKRVFPAFVAGETSTYGYLRSYYFTNKLNGDKPLHDYIDSLFKPLSRNPSPDFAIEEDVIEVKLLEGETNGQH